MRVPALSQGPTLAPCDPPGNPVTWALFPLSTPTLQMGKLRPEELEEHAREHTDPQWWGEMPIQSWLAARCPATGMHPPLTHTHMHTQTHVHACTAPQLFLSHHASFRPPCPTQSWVPLAQAQCFHMHVVSHGKDRMGPECPLCQEERGPQNHSADVS